jgi:hypothetical protein
MSRQDTCVTCVQCAAVFLVWPLISSSNQELQLKRINEPSSQNMNPVNVPKTVRPNESYIVTIDSHNEEGRKDLSPESNC